MARHSSSLRTGCSAIMLLGVLVLIWLVLVQPPSALAHTFHAVLVRSDPSDGSVLAVPPTSVRLWFSEPVPTAGQEIRVIAPSGRRVEYGSIHTNGVELRVDINAAEAGTYLVLWQVTSQDTDPASGRFVFSIGRVSGRWAGITGDNNVSPLGLGLQVVAHWLHFLGYALGFGPLAFLLLVLRPLTLEDSKAVEDRLWRLVMVGILTLLLAEPLALLAQTVSLGMDIPFDPTIAANALSSSFGRVLAERLGAAILLWVLVGIVRQGENRATWLGLILGLALALIDGQASHALKSGPFGLAINALHIAAMGVWVGGLAALLSVWRLKEFIGRHSDMLIRFGWLAATAFAELVVTGVVMVWLRLAHPTDLLSTPYGRVLMVKLIMLLAAMPLVLIGARIRQDHRYRWWTVEAMVLMGVLVLAGLLVSLPPPA